MTALRKFFSSFQAKPDEEISLSFSCTFKFENMFSVIVSAITKKSKKVLKVFQA